MSQRLPELIEPNRMAETGQALKGSLAISKMKRLSPLLIKREGDKEGDANIELAFGVDESGQPNITGKVEIDIALQCQRCMQAMNLHIAEKISLAIIQSSKQASNLASYYEPLIVDEEMVSLSELVEDEILLALPSVPLHELENCPVKLPVSEGMSKQSEYSLKQEKDSEQKNPFDVLKKLKTKE